MSFQKGLSDEAIDALTVMSIIEEMSSSLDKTKFFEYWELSVLWWKAFVIYANMKRI